MLEPSTPIVNNEVAGVTVRLEANPILVKAGTELELPQPTVIAAVTANRTSRVT